MRAFSSSLPFCIKSSLKLLAALFRTFGLPLRFLLLKQSDFSSFLAFSTTDKPVRCLCSHVVERFCVKGFIFRDIHKKQGRSSSYSGFQLQKICGGNYTRARAPLARKSTNGIFESKDGTASIKIVN